MTKTICLCCLLAAFALQLSAQQNDTLDLDYEFYKRRGVWDFAVGGRINFYDFDDMNHTLGQAGLPDVASEAAGVIVAFRHAKPGSRWNVENSFEALWSDSNDGRVLNGTASLYRDFALHSRLMYDIASQKRLTRLFPYIGVGVGLQALRTYKNVPGGGSFVLTLAQEVQKNRFNYTSIPLEAGLSLEQGFRTRIYDIFIGIRGGYTYRVLNSDWALDGDIVVDLPKPAAGAPFLMFTIRLKTDPERSWAAYKKKAKGN